MADWLQLEFLGSSVQMYLTAIAALVIGLVLITLIHNLILSRLKRLTKYTQSDLDDRLVHLVDRHVMRLLYLGVIYLSIKEILEAEGFPTIVEESVEIICLVLATVLVVQLLGSLVEYGARLYWVTRNGDEMMQQSLRALIPAIKIAVWAVGIVFLLDNLGFNITAALASLGIGGVALALAAQGVLADLFSYFAILFDRPFEIGDFVVAGNLVGTVENVGIKTTRIRALSGEELVVANTDITNSRLQNYKRMNRRRVVFHLGVTYETNLDQLMLIPRLIQQSIEKTVHATFDRAHFASYGDFSLNFEAVYFIETGDYNAYMDAQQTINLSIKQTFDREGIEFAYPTQLLYLNQPANQLQATKSNGSNDHPEPQENPVEASAD